MRRLFCTAPVAPCGRLVTRAAHRPAAMARQHEPSDDTPSAIRLTRRRFCGRSARHGGDVRPLCPGATARFSPARQARAA